MNANGDGETVGASKRNDRRCKDERRYCEVDDRLNGGDNGGGN